jgi:hypothetical protein
LLLLALPEVVDEVKVTADVDGELLFTCHILIQHWQVLQTPATKVFLIHGDLVLGISVSVLVGVVLG